MLWCGMNFLDLPVDICAARDVFLSEIFDGNHERQVERCNALSPLKTKLN